MPNGRISKAELEAAMLREGEQFRAYFTWIETHMPPNMFEEIDQEHILLLVHSLMGFNLQDYFSHTKVKGCAFVLCLDSPDADVRILRHYNLFGIKNYRTFISDEPPPFPGVNQKLRIAAIYFTLLSEDPMTESCDLAMQEENKKQIYEALQERNPTLSYDSFRDLLCGMNTRFLKALKPERLVLAFEMYFRALTRDYCQMSVRKTENWKEIKGDVPSLAIVLAWRNTPKHHFLYRLAKMIYRHGLVMKRVNATYIHPYSEKNILVMSIGLHGSNGEAAWEAADMEDFLQEIATLKYFDFMDQVESTFVDTKLVRGNIGNFLRTSINFIHQSLVHAGPNLYSRDNIIEGLCRHPEVSAQVCELFELKFNPKTVNLEQYAEKKKRLLTLIETLDTGNELIDLRRKNVIRTLITFVDHTLKTNFYLDNKSAIGFRLDPNYLDTLPFERKETFPNLPFGIFFIQGMQFIGFHIRFKDLSRGGLRTVIPSHIEQMVAERDNVFLECFNLAHTQQKKNKDIPEGGSKGVLFLEPLQKLAAEADIYKKELKWSGLDLEEIDLRVGLFRQEQKRQYLYQTQRSFMHTLTNLINADEKGNLRADKIIDYWKKPEYIYLGPDENMHNHMIEWIAEYGKASGYRPGSAYISSKTGAGINHKEYGITSFGVNVYMIEVLKYLGIDPHKDHFSVKITGGPDGDVAGNQILNLAKHFPNTAKLVALVDISGTIFDPEGLDLNTLVDLFHAAKPIAAYPVEALHEGAFLLNTRVKKEETAYATKTLLTKRVEGKLIEEWLSGSDMNHILRNNVHQATADIFIPAGGRPRTLSSYNIEEYLDEQGEPTSRAIVEGANLYLTPSARRSLEDKGVVIIKDSSANKGGVICSSLEVLAGLLLKDEEFLEEKPELMEEVLGIIRARAEDEARLLLSTYANTDNCYLTDISDKISEQINRYTNQLLNYFENEDLPSDPNSPLIRCLFSYCPKLLQTKYGTRILTHLPDAHKKAIISCYLASNVVYKKGLEWSPTIVDVIPLISQDKTIFE